MSETPPSSSAPTDSPSSKVLPIRFDRDAFRSHHRMGPRGSLTSKHHMTGLTKLPQLDREHVVLRIKSQNNAQHDQWSVIFADKDKTAGQYNRCGEVAKYINFFGWDGYVEAFRQALLAIEAFKEENDILNGDLEEVFIRVRFKISGVLFDMAQGRPPVMEHAGRDERLQSRLIPVLELIDKLGKQGLIVNIWETDND
ncbi:hypothetical protein F53441_6148 [Fusarium austroafricanum]|uniref:Uncharacterized protein n=1 Tax=Fusarium austroafricanum TaxID=2364996 RepID=A0A8H4KII8_9HYPO|nr:hypothetical protein F53441_6148 [Fusarium austroafricanum]